jgi:hypothetical protein
MSVSTTAASATRAVVFCASVRISIHGEVYVLVRPTMLAKQLGQRVVGGLSDPTLPGLLFAASAQHPIAIRLMPRAVVDDVA